MVAAKLAPDRRRANIDPNQPSVDRSPQIVEPDLRSQVENKFVEMTEAHDRIRGEFLQSQAQEADVRVS